MRRAPICPQTPLRSCPEYTPPETLKGLLHPTGEEDRGEAHGWSKSLHPDSLDSDPFRHFPKT